MKRIAIIVVMALLSLGASARSIHYFTYSQAARTVNYLNGQREIMIYCGYDYEIETYVLVNEIWMERVNSSYYEIWVYGYDAYTGDEVYMPLDLQCVWLYSGGRMYNAAQYLRFRVEARVPGFVWRIPPYNPYTRVVHRAGYRRTYHYDVHRYGWMPPAYTYGPGVPPPPLPHYYMRRPNTPAPMPARTWTPGTSRPEVAAPTESTPIGNTTRATNPSAGSASHNTSSSRAVNSAPTSTRPSTTSTAPARAATTAPARATATTPARATTTAPARATTTTPARTTTTAPTRATTTAPARATTTAPARATTTAPARATTTAPARATTTAPARATTTAPARATATRKK